MRRNVNMTPEENARLLKLHNEKHKRFCAYQSVLRSRWNKYEHQVEGYLQDLQIRYQTQKGVLAGDWEDMCIADFYLPAPWKVILEVDGEYHDLPSQKRRDARKDAFYRSNRFRVCRVNYRQLKTMVSAEELLPLLKAAV